MDNETTVKLKIYEMIARGGRMPDAFDLANELDLPVEQIRTSFKHLYAKRLLVLEPDNDNKIRMAPPFSGIRTPFQVEVLDKSYYANCVWDAYGVAAALQEQAVIRASDGYTREALTLQVVGGKPVPCDYLAHFAVPAAHWWDDIIYT